MVHLSSDIEKIKHALGELCIAWGHLEDSCFHVLLRIMHGAEFTVWELMRNELDLRRALQICKAHAIANNWADHCDHIPVFVDMVDNKIRPARNRYIHDPIYEDVKSAFRVSNVTRYEKVPFSVAARIKGYHDLTSEEIYALARAVRKADWYAAAITTHNDWLIEDEPYQVDSPLLEMSRLNAHFAIEEYTQLTKSSGEAE